MRLTTVGVDRAAWPDKMGCCAIQDGGRFVDAESHSALRSEITTGIVAPWVSDSGEQEGSHYYEI